MNVYTIHHEDFEKLTDFSPNFQVPNFTNKKKLLSSVNRNIGVLKSLKESTFVKPYRKNENFRPP